MEAYRDLVGPSYHVVVGQNEAILIDHETRTRAISRLGLQKRPKKPEVAASGLGCGADCYKHHPVGRTLNNLDGIAFIFQKCSTLIKGLRLRGGWVLSLGLDLALTQVKPSHTAPDYQNQSKGKGCCSHGHLKSLLEQSNKRR
jgi:hypothetical protein